MASKVIRDLKVESLPDVYEILEFIPSIEIWLSRWLSRQRLLLPTVITEVCPRTHMMEGVVL